MSDSEKDNGLPTADNEKSPMDRIIFLFEKVKEQHETISTLKAQLESQNEVLKKHENLIATLFIQIEELRKQKEKNPSSAPTTDVKTDEKAGWGSGDVAALVKEAAEEEQAKLGFVYDPASGFYFDHSSGLYYDHSRQLYYNGHTKTYYTYNSTENKYEFHSQLAMSEVSSPSSSSTGPKVKKSRRKKVLKKKVTGEESDKEDGEVVPSPEMISVSSEDDSDVSVIETPCIRAIVESSSSLKKGFLFIVTCDGGSIGSEGSQHAILIPEEEKVEKHAADITYNCNKNDKEWRYLLWAKEESEMLLNGAKINFDSGGVEIVHGSVLRLGSTILTMHIHQGTLTCGRCEPGIVQIKPPLYPHKKMSKAKKDKERRLEMNRMKLKYALGKGSNPITVDLTHFNDRAEERRQQKGSDNPFEKPIVASIDEPIREENKGFKLLTKMGWKSGEGLGTSNDNPILEPIKVEVRAHRSGLGSSEPPSLVQEPYSRKNQRTKDKATKLAITRQRYNETK